MKWILLILLNTYYAISHATITSGHVGSYEENCKEEKVDISKLQENKMIIIPFYNDHEVWIYKRNASQISKSRTTEKRHNDYKVAKWWPQNENPIDTNISIKNTRSLSDQYFITYAYSPVFGYYLIYLPEGLNVTDQYNYLKKEWDGGFVDVVNQIAYDFTGRPVIVSLPGAATAQDKELSKLNLMVPKYTFDKHFNTVTLLCG